MQTIPIHLDNQILPLYPQYPKFILIYFLKNILFNVSLQLWLHFLSYALSDKDTRRSSQEINKIKVVLHLHKK